jgi:hypothetical protein
MYVQAVQSDTFFERYDAVPAVAGPVGLVAESYTTYITLLERICGGCCGEKQGEGGGEEGIHCCCCLRVLFGCRWLEALGELDVAIGSADGDGLSDGEQSMERKTQSLRKCLFPVSRFESCDVMQVSQKWR